MALMPAAAAAVILTAGHDQLEIKLGDHRILQGLPKTGPAGAAVELGR
jgi:hypothetical protein